MITTMVVRARQHCEAMPMYQERMCGLCKKAPPRSVQSLLCLSCAEVVSRIMPSELYEANYHKDRQAQLVQARLLVKAARQGG